MATRANIAMPPERDPALVRRPPLHLWVVGFLSLLWNAAGAYITFTAQSGRLPSARSAEAAYFESQPLWLIVVADIGVIAALLGAFALLLERREAVWLYAIAPCAIVLANAYELAAGTSLMLRNPAAGWGAAIAIGLMIAECLYARMMRRRGYLV